MWANLALYSVVVCLFTVKCSSKSLYFSQSVCIFHIRGPQIFQTCGNSLQILGARRVTVEMWEPSNKAVCSCTSRSVGSESSLLLLLSSLMKHSHRPTLLQVTVHKSKRLNSIDSSSNQRNTTRTDTQQQHHNRKRDHRKVFVPSGPCRNGTRPATYIATTPAKISNSPLYKPKFLEQL